jgi:glycosyltransferase involved in cell wall biosynthesis
LGHLVAVIIPCYNYGEYVQEAVDSALKQNVDVELIVVDDGSTDQPTIEVLNKLRVAGVQVYRQENQGIPGARNSGIRLTTAEFVVCLDADDLIMPDYCSTCVEILRSKPDIGFVYSTTQVFGSENKLWSKKRFSGVTLLIDDYIPSSAMFRRVVWEQVGGYADQMKRGYEDWDFWLGAFEKGWQGFHISEPLFMYRKHPGSLLHSSNLSRRMLVKLIHSRHPRLFSFRTIISLIKNERFPFLLIGTLIKVYILRRIYWFIKRKYSKQIVPG